MKDSIVDDIKNLCKKNPTYSKLFIKYSEKSEQSISLDLFKSVYNKINTYSSILKNSSFDPLQFESLEKLDDAITLLIEKSQASTLLHSLLSLKYRKLCNDETYELFRHIKNSKISKEELKKFLTKKIAKYNNAKEFNKAIKKIIQQLSEFSVETILNIVADQRLNVKIVVNDNGILILDINDYKASQLLGSPSWCISTNRSYFNQYKENHRIKMNKVDIPNRQFFYWNFNMAPSQVLSHVGFTIEADGQLMAAHNKDDSSISQRALEAKLNIKCIDFAYDDKFWISTIRNSGDEEYIRLSNICKFVKDDSFIQKAYGALLKKRKGSLSKSQLKNYLYRYLMNKKFYSKDNYLHDLEDHLDFFDKYFKETYNNEKMNLLNVMYSYFLLANISHPDFDKYIQLSKKYNLYNGILATLGSKEGFMEKFQHLFGKSTRYYEYNLRNFIVFSYKIHNQSPKNIDDYSCILNILLRENKLSDIISMQKKTKFTSNSSRFDDSLNKLSFILGTKDNNLKYSVLKEHLKILPDEMYHQNISSFLMNSSKYEKRINFKEMSNHFSVDDINNNVNKYFLNKYNLEDLPPKDIKHLFQDIIESDLDFKIKNELMQKILLTENVHEFFTDTILLNNDISKLSEILLKSENKLLQKVLNSIKTD